MPLARSKTRSNRAISFAGTAGSLIALLAGCAMTPTLSFSPDDSGVSTTRDAGAATDATIPGRDAQIDAAIFLPDDDSGTIVLDNDDAGIDGNTKFVCRSGFVNNCQNCPGATLRCAVNGTLSCVSDCTACGPALYPCMHCNAKGDSHGNCVPLNANGRLACSDANRCPCTAGDPNACPRVAAASQTCLADPAGPPIDAGPTDAAPAPAHCYTCGEAKTAQATCDRSDGTSGVCRLASGTPLCK